MNWDKNSDQPFVEMDPKKKRKARLKQFDEMLKILFTGLFLYPLGFFVGYVKQRFFINKKTPIESFFGVGVNEDKFPEKSKEFLEELGVETITIRVPLWEIEKLKNIEDFAKNLSSYKIIFILIPSRSLIENKTKLQENIKESFTRLSHYSNSFQFGVAINRYKWGYYTTKEYLCDLEIVEKIKEEFPKIELLGSSVIDFEYLLSIRTLFNGYSYKLDKLSALLYVDRRGSPKNNQSGLNLIGKIEFLYFLTALSPKVRQKRVMITETNWPIKDSYPYTPTSNDECVDEETQANYLVQYYLLALATRKVESVYWHQLFSPGFGLVDFREGLRKRASFYALQFLQKTLSGGFFLCLKKEKENYKFFFENNNKTIEISWGAKEPIQQEKKYKYYKITGEILQGSVSKDTPIYKLEV